jgi:hypothetical protein
VIVAMMSSRRRAVAWWSPTERIGAEISMTRLSTVP